MKTQTTRKDTPYDSKESSARALQKRLPIDVFLHTFPKRIHKPVTVPLQRLNVRLYRRLVLREHRERANRGRS